VRTRDVPGLGEQQRHGVLGGRDRVGVGRIDHQHAALGGRHQVDVVDADPRPPDHAQTRGGFDQRPIDLVADRTMSPSASARRSASSCASSPMATSTSNCSRRALIPRRRSSRRRRPWLSCRVLLIRNALCCRIAFSIQDGTRPFDSAIGWRRHPREGLMTWNPDHVVVAVDGSEASNHAARVGVSRRASKREGDPRDRGASPGGWWGVGGAPPSPEAMSVAITRARTEVLDPLREEFASASCDVELIEEIGDPASVILRIAEDARRPAGCRPPRVVSGGAPDAGVGGRPPRPRGPVSRADRSLTGVSRRAPE
jgi:hypothetical protein